MGEKIPFSVWMISFPVLKIDFESLGINENYFVKEVFWSETWKWEKWFHFLFRWFHFRFLKLISTPWIKWETFCNRSFLIRGMEVGEIIPFCVWIIPFPVLEINFEPLGLKEKHCVKEVFWSKAWKWEKYFHFLFGSFHFLFWKFIMDSLDQMRNILEKSYFDQRPGSWRNNSISCLDNSISCFEN